MVNIMSKFAVVDMSNLFHRMRHGSSGDNDTKIGLAMHLIFKSLRKLHRELEVDHIVLAVDQGSWRYNSYPNYKSKRRLDRLNATEEEQEENELFFSALNSLITFFDENTRCTVLKSNGIEGDDFIAHWIKRHPNDEHIIISGDSDFIQLIAPNVKIFDAIYQRMISIDKIVDVEGKTVEFHVDQKNGKLKVGKPEKDFIPEEDWWKKALFIKLIRGDVGDSIFSAFPGVRYKGKKHSIENAWDDRHQKGYEWNNLMFQTWDKLIKTSGDEKLTETVRVVDEFKINESLIDLTKQPDDVKQQMDETIDEVISRKPPLTVGLHFIKFCGKFELTDLSKESSEHTVYLNKQYPREK